MSSGTLTEPPSTRRPSPKPQPAPSTIKLVGLLAHSLRPELVRRLQYTAIASLVVAVLIVVLGILWSLFAPDGGFAWLASVDFWVSIVLRWSTGLVVVFGAAWCAMFDRPKSFRVTSQIQRAVSNTTLHKTGLPKWLQAADGSPAYVWAHIVLCFSGLMILAV